MAISNAQAAQINKMNRASQKVSLGTVVQELQVSGSSSSGTLALTVAELKTSASSVTGTLAVSVAALQANRVVTAGSIAVTSTHTNASVVTINTTLGTPQRGFLLQAYRSGSMVAGHPYVHTSSGSLMVMARAEEYSTGSFVLTAGDVYYWTAW